MTSSHRSLPPAHRHLYRREPYHQAHDALTLGDIGGRLVLAALLLVGATGLGLLLPTRHHGTSAAARLGGSLVLALLLTASYLHQAIWQPLMGKVENYRLVGEFTVREKFSVFGRKMLRLGPAEEQRLTVTDQLYDLLREGDQVRLIYSAAGELVSASKVWGAGR